MYSLPLALVSCNINYCNTYVPIINYTYIHRYLHTYIHTCIHRYLHTYIHNIFLQLSHSVPSAQFSSCAWSPWATGTSRGGSGSWNVCGLDESTSRWYLDHPKSWAWPFSWDGPSRASFGRNAVATCSRLGRDWLDLALVDLALARSGLVVLGDERKTSWATSAGGCRALGRNLWYLALVDVLRRSWLG